MWLPKPQTVDGAPTTLAGYQHPFDVAHPAARAADATSQAPRGECGTTNSFRMWTDDPECATGRAGGFAHVHPGMPRRIKLSGFAWADWGFAGVYSLDLNERGVALRLTRPGLLLGIASSVHVHA